MAISEDEKNRVKKTCFAKGLDPVSGANPLAVATIRTNAEPRAWFQISITARTVQGGFYNLDKVPFLSIEEIETAISSGEISLLLGRVAIALLETPFCAAVTVENRYQTGLALGQAKTY